MPADDPKVTIIPPAIGWTIPWLKALGVAVIGAFVVGALDAAQLLLVGEGGLDPWTRDGLRHMVRAGLAAAIPIFTAYLLHSPRVRHEWSEEERAARRATLEAQGRLPAATAEATPPPPAAGGTRPPSHGGGAWGSE